MTRATAIKEPTQITKLKNLEEDILEEHTFDIEAPTKSASILSSNSQKCKKLSKQGSNLSCASRVHILHNYILLYVEYLAFENIIQCAARSTRV